MDYNMDEEVICEEQICCEVCREHTPKSAALHYENVDMVMHFCGAGCLSRWQEENGVEQKII